MTDENRPMSPTSAFSAGKDDADKLREYVQAGLERFSQIRDNKETQAFTGIAIFFAAVAAAIASEHWPPPVAKDKPSLVIVGYGVLWAFVLAYLRYQLRRRRWAAMRVAACDWLLIEWLPGSKQALSKVAPIDRGLHRVSTVRRIVDYFWPLKHSVAVIDPNTQVYPDVIEQAFLKLEARGTDAVFHERIVQLAGWVCFGAICTQVLLAK